MTTTPRHPPGAKPIVAGTVGYHRRFTHGAFTAIRPLRTAVAGGLAAPGPVLSRVAGHRRHHAFAEGGPHHADPTRARHGVLRGPIDFSARVLRIVEELAGPPKSAGPPRTTATVR
jgi:fatty-acid desaturase